MNTIKIQQLTLAKKIEIEKRKRHQLYNTMDYVLSNNTYFDFFSKDCFSIIKNGKILAYLLSRKKVIPTYALAFPMAISSLDAIACCRALLYEFLAFRKLP